MTATAPDMSSVIGQSSQATHLRKASGRAEGQVKAKSIEMDRVATQDL
jgi:hypothetical protein